MPIEVLMYNLSFNLPAFMFIQIILILMGVCMKLDFQKFLRASLTVGVGLMGVAFLLETILHNLSFVPDMLGSKFQMENVSLDIGNFVISAVSFSTAIGAVIIPFIFAVNVILVKLKLTNTVNTDLWNYWHYAFTGSIVWLSTGSYALGLFGAAIHLIITLKIADVTADLVQSELKMKGVTISHGFSSVFIPVFALLDRIYDKIPFFNKETEPKSLPAYWAWFSEPTLLGILIGLVLGFLCNDYSKGFMSTVETIMFVVLNMVALVVLLPRICKVIMEGLIPFSKATKQFVDRLFVGRSVNICLDSAVLVGRKNTVHIATILVPIYFLVAVFVLRLQVIPFVDLTTLIFFVAFATPIHKGNARRTLVSCLFLTVFSLFGAASLSPLITEMVYTSGLHMSTSTTVIGVTSLVAGGNYVAILLHYLLNQGVWGFVAVILVTTVVVKYTIQKEKNRAIKQDK
ncbi:PTS transporter subunit IIC [Chakrabartyella piscis]|uniref:PTS transporter subunit IIC n=1 Tax=Chakrabartyella piscis TaxID=2918914 RepID=UPI0029586F91|nr:PTS transporter subunit IIC [Chakrabartyella piscis]